MPHFGTRGVRDAPLSCRCVFVLISCFLTVASSLPVASRNEGNVSVSAISQAVEFLTRYGYLPPSDPKTGNLRSEAEFREAIATMQRFGGLPPTGQVDEATVTLMNSRRCGVPDFQSPQDRKSRLRRFAIQGQKWPSTKLTWSIKSKNASSTDPLVLSQLRRAFEVWSEASALTFSEVSGSADIIVSFLKGPHGDGYPFDGEGAILAHAFFPGDGIGGDAHFDAEERWLTAQPEDNNGVNLFAVAAHEIGHSLGLSHSSILGSLMFPYYQDLGNHYKLPKDDAEGIRHLYGHVGGNSEPTMPTLAPKTSTETITTRQAKVTTKKYHTKPKMPTRPTKNPISSAPDMCSSSIDAISLIRREIFVFKGNYFWRLHVNRTLREGYPVNIDRFWYDLPPNITKVDALYVRPSDTKIVFFSGKNYWLFSANQMEPGYPKPLTHLGLAEDVDHIDAALVWGYNSKTFLFSGDKYWKFDEDEGRVELDYPRNITKIWKGVPNHIDAAFQWDDGNTYFFKKTKFWKFVDVKMEVEKKTPSEIGGFWFQCPSKSMENTTPETTTTTFEYDIQQEAEHHSSASLTFSYLYVLFFANFCVLCNLYTHLRVFDVN